MTNDEKLDLFADLLEPAAEIIGDKDVAAALKGGGKPAAAARLAIKAHKGAVVEVLARLDGKNPAEYEVPGPVGLAAKLLQLLNDPELQNLFISQHQESDAASFGAATASTEGGAN